MVQRRDRSRASVGAGGRTSQAIHAQKHARERPSTIRRYVAWTEAQRSRRFADACNYAGIYDFRNQDRLSNRVCIVPSVPGYRYGGLFGAAVDGNDAVAPCDGLASIQSSLIHYGRRVGPCSLVAGEKLCLKK